MGIQVIAVGYVTDENYLQVVENIMVEAGGVEPPSEKARREETTCVAGSRVSATASEPATAAAA